MPRSGYIADRGSRGYQLVDKRIVMGASAWLEPQGSVVLFDDFNGVVNLDLWDVITEGGTAFALSLTAGDPVAGHGGWIASALQTGAADEQEAIGGEVWWNSERAGNGLMVFETRVSRGGTITASSVYGGFIDNVTQTAEAFPINSSDVVGTIPPADYAVITHSSVAATAKCYGLCGTGGTDSPKTDFGGPTTAASKAYRWRVEIDAAQVAYFYVSEAFETTTYSPNLTFLGARTGGGASGTLLAPTVGSHTTASGVGTMEVDYIFAACGR